jgi:hypothetical protein
VGRLWCEHDAPVDCEDGKPWTKYILADSVAEKDKEIARLTELNNLLELRFTSIEELQASNDVKDRQLKELAGAYILSVEDLLAEWQTETLPTCLRPAMKLAQQLTGEGK